MKQSVLWGVWGCKFLAFPGEKKNCFCHQAQYPGSQKQLYWSFQAVSKTRLGHTARFHEKRCFRRVFFECWLPYLLLPWLGQKTVMSDKFSAKGSKQPISFKKLRSSTKVFAIMKTIQSVFLAVLRLERFSFHREENTAFVIWPKYTGSAMQLCLQILSSVKYTPRHTTPLMSKDVWVEFSVSGECHICYYPN